MTGASSAYTVTTAPSRESSRALHFSDARHGFFHRSGVAKKPGITMSRIRAVKRAARGL